MPRFDLESYVQVKERIKKFRADHPDYALRSEIVTLDDKRVVVHGWIMDDVDRILADGHAEEIRGSSNVNTTSALENCETSAWGRALANLGYEVDKAIASREEMEKVERQTTGPPPAGDVTLSTMQNRLFERAANLGTEKLSAFKARVRERFGDTPFDGESLKFERFGKDQVDELNQWITEEVTPDPADEPF